MKVTLLYFHRAREAAGLTTETVDLGPGPTAADALEWAAQAHPALRDLKPVLRLAVNEEYAAPNRRLLEGDVVALLPPVSGG
jgi:molybdopterin converting factor subunit 1